MKEVRSVAVKTESVTGSKLFVGRSFAPLLMVVLTLSVGMCVAAGVEWSTGLPIGWVLLLLVVAFVQFKSSSGEAEQLLQSVLELSSDHYCLYQNSTIQLSSQSLQTLFRDWGNEKFWQSHLNAEDFRDFGQAVQSALAGKNSDLKVQLLHRPGVLVSLSPLLDACQGTQVPVELSFRKVAWLQQPAVLVRIHICSVRTRAVQDFAQTLNHELRTPLNIIIGTCDLMLTEHSTSAQTKRRLHLARECASTFLATLSSLMQQCELRWGLAVPLHVPFVPARVVAMVVSASEKKLQEHGNHVEVATSGLPDLLWGSAAQLKQALSLLLRSCSILVRNQLVALHISANVSEHRCELRGSLSARDAPSLESDYQSALHLFSLPFVDQCEDWTERLEKIESKALLHLAVAREVCRLLLGDLEVKTAEGGLLWEFTLSFSTCKEVMLKRKEGLFPELEEVQLGQKESFRMQEESLASNSPSPASTPVSEPLAIARRRKSIPHFAASFSTWTSLTVPQAPTRSLQLPLHAGDSPPSSACFHDLPLVLVADDVPLNSLILQEMLRRLNVAAETVSNGAEAVAQVQLWEPVLIFMDCEMPVMDGLEATRLLRSMGVSVPIIGVTANGPEKEAECLEAGMSHFLCKPVSYRRLEALVGSLL